MAEKEIVHRDATSIRRVMSASTLSKDSVRNRMNEELGSINEIMIDVPTGRIAYAVLGVGGFLGLGEHLFAIPWRALTLDEEHKCFILDIDRQKLKEAPGFDKDHWPDMANPGWANWIDSYWNKPGSLAAVSGESGHDEIGRDASRHYDREATTFSDREVDQKANEARKAVDSPEGAELRQAEEIGKSRSKSH